MSLTEDESEYIDLVRDRAMLLIDCHVWEGIQKDRLAGWMGSLKNIDAELLGAYLLDNLCYRSRGQYNAMLDVLFLDLPMPGGAQGELLINGLMGKKSGLSGIYLSPVIGQAAPPTKSGPFILRLVQRRYQLHNDWLVWPHMLAVARKVTDLYFVDDFCGTGEQFDKFLKGIHFDHFRQANPGTQAAPQQRTCQPVGVVPKCSVCVAQVLMPADEGLMIWMALGNGVEEPADRLLYQRRACLATVDGEGVE